MLTDSLVANVKDDFIANADALFTNAPLKRQNVRCKASFPGCSPHNEGGTRWHTSDFVAKGF